jgi:hypothetical protein
MDARLRMLGMSEGRAAQLARLKQGPLDAKSVPPVGQQAGVGKGKPHHFLPWVLSLFSSIRIKDGCAMATGGLTGGEGRLFLPRTSAP